MLPACPARAGVRRSARSLAARRACRMPSASSREPKPSANNAAGSSARRERESARAAQRRAWEAAPRSAGGRGVPESAGDAQASEALTPPRELTQRAGVPVRSSGGGPGGSRTCSGCHGKKAITHRRGQSACVPAAGWRGGPEAARARRGTRPPAGGARARPAVTGSRHACLPTPRRRPSATRVEVAGVSHPYLAHLCRGVACQ